MKVNRWQGVVIAVACVAALGLTVSMSRDSNAADGNARLEAAVQRLRDGQEIQNLMAKRMWYHSIGHNEQELALWAKKHPIRWAQNQGCYVGMASLKVYYDDINRKMQAAELKRLSELNPAIKNIPENRFVGNTILHTLSSPMIVVAEDGQSAKGLWYTPGVILAAGDAKTGEANWIWERYGVDFIKEDGQWRFLNVQVNTDFMQPVGVPWSARKTNAESAAAMGKEGASATPAPGPGAEAIKIPGPDIAKPTFEEWSTTRVPSITPRMPEPYRTLSETFQYASCQ